MESPVVEPLGDGRYRVTVSFHDPEAKDVWLIGGLAGADPADRRLRRDAGGWWSRSYEVGGDAVLSYLFTRVLVPSGLDDLVADPLNPRGHTYAADPDDPDDEEMTVSIVELPDAEPRRSLRDVPRGLVSKHRVRSTILGNERAVFTYTPPGYDPATEYPLVVCFDGFAYVSETYVPLPAVLDELIADGSVSPIVAVVPSSLDNETRSRELQLHEPFVEFLTDELLPWARERVSFGDDPARTLVGGASLGGLAALFCGLRRPDRFGLVLSQSGAFQRGELQETFAAADRLPLRVYLDVGAYERVPHERNASLYHANVHLRDVLVAKGYEVAFREFPGGHDYFWWRETIAGGLTTLLG